MTTIPFTVSILAKPLKEIITQLNFVKAHKAVIPELENVVLEKDDKGCLQLCGTDLEVYMTVSTKIRVAGDFKPGDKKYL